MIQWANNQPSNRQSILLRILGLRAIALVVAIVVLLVFQFVLEQSLDYPVLYGITFAAIIYSLATLIRLRSNIPVTDVELFIHLLMDALILLVLIFFSGRATNPFIYYLLVLVGISATLFNRRVSWLFAGFSVIAYTGLLYLDLEEHIHHLFSGFQLHLIGMWVNFVGSTLLLNLFISMLATALRNRELHLAQAREETLKNEQLVAIGTLAASTVHALGTPLSTMAIMLGEMKNEKSHSAEDFDLLMSQIERCKKTMSKLSHIASSKESTSEAASVAEFMAQLKEHYLLLNPKILPIYNIEAAVSTYSIRDNLLFLYAIINLVDNAIRAATSEVVVSVSNVNQKLQFKIQDDGTGIPAELVENFGKPNISRSSEGLGIGIFLANTTIEKMDGRIVLFNARDAKDKKTTLLVEIPVSE